MEFLRDAVDKSRQVGRQRRRSASNRMTLSEEFDISYSETAVVPVDARVFERNRVVAAREQDEYADAYRMLRSRILQKMRNNGWNSLGITSTGPGQGKSLTSVNLALSMAHKVDQTVLLVDYDLRRPSVRTFFEYSNPLGLPHYITKGTSLSEILFNPGINRLVVLPGGKPTARSSEVLTSPRMRRLTNELTSRYASRIVIFDLPPLLVTDDAFAILPQIDCILLVVEEGGAQREEVAHAVTLLREYNFLGAVLNKSEDKHSPYSYKSKYY